MTTFVKVDSGRVVRVAIADANPNTDVYDEAPTGVSTGWVLRNGNYYGPNGETPADASGYVLDNWEWRFRFTDAEWDWLVDKRDTTPATTASKRLTRLMDAIMATASVNVEVGAATEMDEFYTWLLNNGIPGGQTRIDELREPK